MPPHRLQQSLLASIELATTSLSYTAGDTLTGHVQRLSETVSPVSVTLSLHSRIKTRLVTSGAGRKRSHWRWYSAAAVVFSNTQCLFQGVPAQGMNKWPFTVTIPAYGNRDGIRVDIPPTYESTGRDDIDEVTHRNHLYCEWWLEAQITDEASRKKFSILDKKPATAIFPIFMRPPSTGTDIMVQQCVAEAHLQQTIKSYKLDPGASRSSSRPRFSFLVKVLYPTTMQIGGRDALPFRISITEHTLDPAPDVFLAGADIRLQYATTARNLDGDSRARSSENTWEDVSRLTWHPGMVIPQQPRDIGGMCVTWDGLVPAGQDKKAKVPPAMWPAYDGYYMAVKHQITWLLTLKCAGKTVKMEGSAPVVVYGPSEEAERHLVERLGDDATRAYKAWAGGDVRVPGEVMLGI